MTEWGWSCARKRQYYTGAFIDWSHCSQTLSKTVVYSSFTTTTALHLCTDNYQNVKIMEAVENGGKSCQIGLFGLFLCVCLNRLCWSPERDKVLWISTDFCRLHLHFMDVAVAFTRLAVLNDEGLVSLLRTQGCWRTNTGHCGHQTGNCTSKAHCVMNYNTADKSVNQDKASKGKKGF